MLRGILSNFKFKLRPLSKNCSFAAFLRNAFGITPKSMVDWFSK